MCSAPGVDVVSVAHVLPSNVCGALSDGHSLRLLRSDAIFFRPFDC